MSNDARAVLILGGTGRTGSRVAGNLARRGISTRTAARRGADVQFAERNARAWTWAAK